MRENNDCSVVALAALARISYEGALLCLECEGREKDDGVSFPYLYYTLLRLGYICLKVEHFNLPSDEVIQYLKDSKGMYLVVSWHDVIDGKGVYHVTAVRDGKVFDCKSNNESRNLIDKVYLVSRTGNG